MPLYTARQFTDYGPAILVFGDSSPIIFDASASNPNGGSDGGVGISIAHEMRDSKRDATGAENHDSTVVGQMVAVRSPLAGLSLEQFEAVIPGAVLSDGPATKSLELRSPVGMSARDNAELLIIKPLINGVMSTDESDWIQFEKAFPVGQFDFLFSNEDTKVYNVEWKIFRDTTSLLTAEIGVDAAV